MFNFLRGSDTGEYRHMDPKIDLFKNVLIYQMCWNKSRWQRRGKGKGGGC